MENKYASWYYSIISKVLLQERSLEKAEKHHIIPRCIGGDDSEQNIVELAPREHFLCHWLLTKMYDGVAKQKLYHAFWMMTTRNKNKDSRLYQRAKETRYSLFPVWNKGKSLSKEHKAKLKANHVGMTGKVHSEETKAKMSQASKGQPSYWKGRTLPKIQCPHCFYWCAKGQAHRWHFDNCKAKELT